MRSAVVVATLNSRPGHDQLDGLGVPQASRLGPGQSTSGSSLHSEDGYTGCAVSSPATWEENSPRHQTLLRLPPSAVGELCEPAGPGRGLCLPHAHARLLSMQAPGKQRSLTHIQVTASMKMCCWHRVSKWAALESPWLR